MKKLLAVIDMQNDFIDGALGTPEAQAIVEQVVKKVQACQEAGYEVVFTMDTHDEDYLETQEGKKLPVAHCIKGSDGWQLNDGLEEFVGLRFKKHTFGSRKLAKYIKHGSYDEVELVGLCTDICVISNALLIKAFSPETSIVVDSACCAGVTPASHQTALEAMKVCQIDVR